MISKHRIAKTVCAAGLAAAALGLAFPAAAQFFPFDDRFFGPPRQQAPRPRIPTEAEQLNAPAPKQPEAPPTIRILVLGDSMADWLAYGLEEALTENPEIGIVRKHKAYSGLIRYEQRGDTEWSKVARDLIAHEKPQAIVMLVGLHDRQAMRERAGAVAPAKPVPPKPGSAEAPRTVTPQANAQAPQPKPATNPNDDEAPAAAPAPEAPRAKPGPVGPAEFRTEKWEELYGARVDETIAALKSGNVPVLWVGVPSIRGQKSTADLQYLNDLVKARVEKAGLIFVNPWDGFVDDRNNFMQRGPDETGQVRQLRTYDGIHFTKFGARKLAHYVERDLRRVLREPIPAALNVPADPAPQQAQPAKPSGPATRPLAGPVILLGTPLNEPDDLLGGPPPVPQGRAAAQPAAPPPAPALDPVANRMLVKGEPMRSEPGRADDMSWPPRLPVLVTKEQLPPTGAPLTIVRAPAPVQQAALQPGQKPGVPGQPGQPVVRQQVRQQQAQAPTFWRRQTQDTGPRFFFGLFGR